MLSYKLCHKVKNRFVIHIAHRQIHESNLAKPLDDVSKDQSGFINKARENENPNLIEKIVLRFLGIPLKGEKEKPRALLEDVGKRIYIEPVPTVPKDYKEFPERDLVNFPYPNRPLTAPDTRVLMIPDHWCREIEKVTGASGPYLLIFGFVAFVFNKELFVLDDHGYYLLYGWVPIFLFFKSALGYKADVFAKTVWKETFDTRRDIIKSELQLANEFRKNAKEQSASFKAVQEHFPTIFRENLALQLEATYRKNVDYAWSELKRRLDYLNEVQAVKERFAKERVLKTITDGVRKQIETNEGGIREKYMDQCIEQLKMLAPK